jgi:thioredoxin reductase (NADPH)
MSVRDLLIVGAGPTGLSAAIAAKMRGLDYQVIEQGTLVNSIYRFPPQMVFFTTPELLEIGGLPFVSPYDKPTRTEALRYYRKVVDHYDLQIAYGEQVQSIERETETGVRTFRGRESTLEPEGRDHSATGERGWGPASSENDDSSPTLFAVTTQSSRGVRRVRHARAVILAIGYFDRPVLLGVPGEDLPHVHHYYGDPHPYYRQRVVVVGGGNSAAEWALELYRAGASVTLVHRGSELKSTIKYWVRPDIENRIKEGAIAARFNAVVSEIHPTAIAINDTRSRESTPVVIPADAVFLLTGYRADVDLMQRAGVALTEREGPVHDPATFETNVPDLFVAGGAIAGVDTGTIFIENGRFHGRMIVDVIARRLEG